jgi:hypothetical protein
LRFRTISNFVGNCTGRSRLRAAQDAIDIGGGATPVVYQVDSVGELGIGRLVLDRRYLGSGRRRYDQRAMSEHPLIRHYDKAASRLVPKGRDGRFDVYVAMILEANQVRSALGQPRLAHCPFAA